jgi:hypothetical protein
MTMEDRSSQSQRLLLSKLSCRRLILQPTNAHTHLWTLLYNQWQSMNWSVRVTSVPTKCRRNSIYPSLWNKMPPSCFSLLCSSRNNRGPIIRFQDAARTLQVGTVAHHATWIRQDVYAARTAVMRMKDGQWLSTGWQHSTRRTKSGPAVDPPQSFAP